MTSYFATYELLKKKLSPPAPIIPGTGEKAAAPPLSIGAVMLAGGTAGVAMWSVAIPPDVSQGVPEGIAHCGSSARDIEQNRKADDVDDQIPTPIRSSGDILWFPRLCPKANRCGWSNSTLERIRTRHGTSFPC